MSKFLRKPIRRLRIIGITEGVSYLVLLCIAMPLKYFLGLPQAVKMVGWAHGILFILYILAIMNVAIVHRWTFFKIAIAFIASLVPLGTFILDPRLKKEEKSSV